MAAREWHAARSQFALLFGDRFETFNESTGPKHTEFLILPELFED